MARSVWPESLPCPLASGSGEYTKAFDNIIRTPKDYGEKSRRRFTTVPNVMTVSFLLSKAELEQLLDFYEVELKEVDPFEWVEWRSQIPYTTVYKFDSYPDHKFVRGKGKFIVNFRLRILKRFDGEAVIDVAGDEGYYST